MKVLITGVNGFVGRTLLGSLRTGVEKIYGIDLEGKGDNIYPVDITDPIQMTSCIKEISPDFIFHLAAVSRVDVTNHQNIFDINVSGTLNLLSASIKLKKIPAFLFVSSSQVYGRVDKSRQPITEDEPVNPVNLYGASKAAGENIVMAFHHEFGLPAVIVRPFNHTGRGQAGHFVIPKLIREFRNNTARIELGNLQVYRDFLDVRDVVDAYIRIMNNFTDGEIFNISSGECVLLTDIISIIRKKTGHNPEIISDDSLRRKNEIDFSMGDSSRIKQKLGWEPLYTLAETLEWMLEE